MTIQSTSFLYINISIVLFFFIMCILGYKKGIIRTAINFIGTLASLWISTLLAPVCADYAHIWKEEWTPLQDSPLKEAVYAFLNEMIWVVLLFILIKIFFAFLEHFAKGLQNIPVLGTVSSLLGAVLHALTGVVWILIFAVILNLPVFTNGKEVIQGTFLNPIIKVTDTVTKNHIQPLLESQAFDSWIKDAGALQDNQREVIKNWLETHGYSTESVGEGN